MDFQPSVLFIDLIFDFEQVAAKSGCKCDESYWDQTLKLLSLPGWYL